MSYEAKLGTGLLIAALVPLFTFSYIECTREGAVRELPLAEQAIVNELEALAIHVQVKSGGGFGAEYSGGHVTIGRTWSGNFHIVSVELLIPIDSPEYRATLLKTLVRCPKLSRVAYPGLSADAVREYKAALPQCDISTESPSMGNTTCELRATNGARHG